MSEPARGAARAAFLAENRLPGAELAALAGDASSRRYFRVNGGRDTPLILMDAPPQVCGSLQPFLNAARIFAAAGLSVPRIEAADTARGFLLMEDFGVSAFGYVITRQAGAEAELYHETLLAILALQRGSSTTGLPHHDHHARAQAALPAYRDYAGHPARGAAEEAFVAELEAALAAHCSGPSVVVHRDCHADNLFWLPERRGIARVGWIDFQDAEAGHPAYDLASLAKDARRDLAPGLEDRLIDRFLVETGQDREEFTAAYAVLGAQRNLRILGVFARLSRLHGKSAYLALMPRVWTHLTRSLDHPALSGLRRRVIADLPPPDAATLSRLREPCPITPTH